MQYEDIGRYIRFRRGQINKSLNEFAMDNDVDSAILSRIENSKQDIKLNILRKIAGGFGMSAAEFLSEFEQTNSSNVL